MLVRQVLLAGLITLFTSPAANGQDHWPQFRGHAGSGVGGDGVAYPDSLDPETNLLWKTPVPRGHSSPCIWEDRIFITGATDDHVETVCIDRTTGEVLWRRPIPVGTFERGHDINSPASSTPTTDGTHVCIYFGSLGLLCYDMDGNELWQRAMPMPENRFGSASSPVFASGKLIFLNDTSADSFLEAIDPATGKIIWRKERPGFGAGWSSPMVWTNGGVEEIVCYGTEWITSYALADGTEQWSMPGVTDEPCITPVHGNGLIFLSSYNMRTNPEVIGLPKFEDLLKDYDTDTDGQLTFEEAQANKSILSRFDADGEGDHPLTIFFRFLDRDRNELLTAAEWTGMQAFLDQYKFANGLLAVRPGNAERPAEIAWQHNRGVPECPSPLLYGGRVYLIKNGGLASCFNAATGTVHYQQRLSAGGPYYASPVAADGKVYIASARGDVTVIRAGDAMEIASEHDLGERIMATPALVGGNVYVRTEGHVMGFGAD